MWNFQEHHKGPNPCSHLNRIDIHDLLGSALGKTTPMIAAHRHVNPCTVSMRKKAIFSKLGADNVPHAVALGFCYGILPSDMNELVMLYEQVMTDDPPMRKAA